MTRDAARTASAKKVLQKSINVTNNGVVLMQKIWNKSIRLAHASILREMVAPAELVVIHLNKNNFKSALLLTCIFHNYCGCFFFTFLVFFGKLGVPQNTTQRTTWWTRTWWYDGDVMRSSFAARYTTLWRCFRRATIIIKIIYTYLYTSSTGTGRRKLSDTQQLHPKNVSEPKCNAPQTYTNASTWRD